MRQLVPEHRHGLPQVSASDHQYHHIVDWAAAEEYVPVNMMVLFPPSLLEVSVRVVLNSGSQFGHLPSAK
jgi:hypothetical protein